MQEAVSEQFGHKSVIRAILYTIICVSSMANLYRDMLCSFLYVFLA